MLCGIAVVSSRMGDLDATEAGGDGRDDNVPTAMDCGDFIMPLDWRLFPPFFLHSPGVWCRRVDMAYAVCVC